MTVMTGSCLFFFLFFKYLQGLISVAVYYVGIIHVHIEIQTSLPYWFTNVLLLLLA